MARFVVVGGGIAGLAATVALARHGHRVTVCERSPEFTELGAGIQLAPNAFHALDRLGVGEQVRARAVFIDELRFLDGVTGERVAHLPLGPEYRERFGNPYAVVGRVDLYQPLLQACRAAGSVELRSGCRVVGYQQRPNGAAVVLASGASVPADAVIGADGIRSTVRQQLLGDGEPRVSGHTIYRCVVPIAAVPEQLRWNAVALWAGPRWHFVHYPIAGGRHLNLAATRDDRAQQVVTGKPVETEHVRDLFAGLSPTARRLLHLGDAWRTWVLCDRDPVPRWADGPVLLIGDAAHPMLQYAAQGAGMALEDAVLLGDLLADAATGGGPDPPDLPELFGRFTATRRDRTARTQLVSRELGTQLYHPAGAAAGARNAMLGGLTIEQLYEKVAWLHTSDGGVRCSRT